MMSTTRENASEIPRPLTVGELLRQHPPGRITGWDPSNPLAVEMAFRTGYSTGSTRFVESRAFGFVHDEPCDLELAVGMNDALHRRRAKLYDSDRWSDRRAALLRGCQHGLLDAVRARAAGVSAAKLVGWLNDLEDWATERPLNLNWSSACPPDPPEPDGPPLGRDGVPKPLWGEVFGALTMVDALSAPVTLVRQRNPFVESREQYNKVRAAALADLRQRIRAHKGKFTGLETLGQYEPDVRAVWREELATRTAPKPGPVVVRLSDVHPELLRWLWPGRIALGKLTLLAGDPGLGKSFVTLDLAARVSSGTAWPDLPLLPNPAGDVVLLSAEDDLSDTIRPRLDAAGAEATRVVAIQAVRRVLVTGQTQEDYFDLTEDLPALESAIQQVSDCRLVIIDPLTAYLGKTDSHKNAEVRAVLAKLFELAARHKVAVLAVTHLNKANTLPAIYRAMGSLAFVAAARAVWAVVRDDEDDTGRRRLFLPVKSNLSPDETGLAYALEPVGQTARVAWESGAVTMRADDALGGGRKAIVRDDATEFVIATLKANGGDMLSDDLATAAEIEGISERTLRRAKKVVTESYKEKGRGGRWRCKLKGGQEDGQDTHCPN